MYSQCGGICVASAKTVVYRRFSKYWWLQMFEQGKSTMNVHESVRRATGRCIPISRHSQALGSRYTSKIAPRMPTGIQTADRNLYMHGKCSCLTDANFLPQQYLQATEKKV